MENKMTKITIDKINQD